MVFSQDIQGSKFSSRTAMSHTLNAKILATIIYRTYFLLQWNLSNATIHGPKHYGCFVQVVSVSSNLTRTAAQQCGRIMQENIHCAYVLASMWKARVYDRSPAFSHISHEDGDWEAFLEIVKYFLTSVVTVGSEITTAQCLLGRSHVVAIRIRQVVAIGR